MSLDADAVHGAIVRALQETERRTSDDEPLSQRAIQGLAFHLSDWLAELEAYHAFAQDPDRPASEVVELLNSLLANVPYHLREAQRIWER